MVYKKYIIKKGKKYGPYYYESYRDEKTGKVKKRYLGNSVEQKKKSFLNLNNFFIVFSIIFLLSLGFFVFNFYIGDMTGRASLNIQDQYIEGETIQGNLELVLKKGELIPANAELVIEQNGSSSKYLFSDLVSSNSNGSYYTFGNNLSGNGSGYGFKGKKEIYPVLNFVLKLAEITNDTSPDEGGGEEIEEENKTTDENETTEEDTNESIEEPTNETTEEDTNESIEEPTNETTEEENVSEEDTVDENETTEEETNTDETTENISTEEPVDEEPVKEKQDTDEEITPDEEPVEEEKTVTTQLTAAIIQDLNDFYFKTNLDSENNLLRGNVSKNNSFRYDIGNLVLSSVVSVNISNDSLVSPGEELSSDVLDIEKKGEEIIVSTDYFKEIKGFGQDYVLEETDTLKLALSKIGVVAREGKLNISLVYRNQTISSVFQEISVEKPENETLNETENLTFINETLNETENLTFENQTELNQTLVDKHLQNISLKQYSAVVGRPVKWVKRVSIRKNETSEYKIELPKNAKNISVKTSNEIKELDKEIKDYEKVVKETNKKDIVSGKMTGMVSMEIEEQKGILTRFFEWVGSLDISGNVVSEKQLREKMKIKDTGDFIEINVSDIVKNQTQEEVEVASEYYTEAPKVNETSLEKGKRIVVSDKEENNYTNVLAYTVTSDSDKLRNISMNDTSDLELYWYASREDAIKYGYIENDSLENKTLNETENKTLEILPENNTNLGNQTINKTNSSKGKNNSNKDNTPASNMSKNKNISVLTGRVVDNVSEDNLTNNTLDNETENQIINETENQTVEILSENETSISDNLNTSDKIKVSVNYTAYDLDEDGYVDYVEWNVPHLSNQTYDLIIEISEAEHLDENRTFIRDVYNETSRKDENFVLIPNKEYLRVKFEKNLTKGKDITFYARSNNSNTSSRVEVYEKDKNETLMSFDNVSEYKEYKKYFDNVSVNFTQDVFDLRVFNKENVSENIGVEFDYVVDPQKYIIEEYNSWTVIHATGTISDSVKNHWENWGGDHEVVTVGVDYRSGEHQDIYRTHKRYPLDTIPQDAHIQSADVYWYLVGKSNADVNNNFYIYRTDDYGGGTPTFNELWDIDVLSGGKYVGDMNTPDGWNDEDITSWVQNAVDSGDSEIALKWKGSHEVLDDNRAYWAITDYDTSTTAYRSYLDINYISNDFEGTVREDIRYEPPFSHLEINNTANKYAEFDGDGDYIDTSFNGTEHDDLTISTWINVGGSTSESYQYIVDNSPGAAGYGLRYRNSDGILSFFAYNGTAAQTASSDSISQDRWYHVVVKHSDDGNQIYIDGILNGTVSSTSGIVGSSDTFTIGEESSNPGSYFNGSIDEVQVFDRALSETEIQEIYTLGRQRYNLSTEGLVGQWDFNDGLDNFDDKSGNNHDGTGKGDVYTVLDEGFPHNKMGSSLAGYWSFDSNQNIIAYDLTNQDNDGRYRGDAQTSASGGKYDDGLVLDGDGDYIDTSFNGTEYDDLTISTWINVGSSTSESYQYIVDNSPGAAGYGLRYRNSDGALVFFAYNGTNAQPITSDSISQNKWYHVVVKHSDDGNQIYIDGILNGTVSSTSGIVGSSDTFTIGEESSNLGSYFKGSIDEVQVFDRALNETEIQEIYDEKSNRFYSQGNQTFKAGNISVGDNVVNLTAYAETSNGSSLNASLWEADVENNTGYIDNIGSVVDNSLIGYWHLDDIKGTDTLEDFSGQGNDGTNNGATVKEGYWNNGFDFDGAGDYIALDMYYDTSGEISYLTTSAWVKVPTDGGDWSVLDFDRSEYFTFAAGIPDGSANGEGDYVGFHTADSGGMRDMWSNSQIRDNKWHLITLVFDKDASNDKKIYIDGELDAETNQHSGAIGTGVTRYGFIGDGSEASSFDGSRNELYFQGSIDEVMIFNRSLSEEEIKELYVSGSIDYKNSGAGVNWTESGSGEQELNELNSTHKRGTFGVSSDSNHILPEYKFYSGGLESSDFYTPILYNTRFDFYTVPLDISIVYPESKLYRENVTSLNYTLSGGSTLDKCWYSTDGGVTNSSSVSAGTNFTGIESMDGELNWTVYCNESSGNETKDSVHFWREYFRYFDENASSYNINVRNESGFSHLIVTDPSLKGYWSFDADMNFPEGQVDKGIDLDGEGDYVDVSHIDIHNRSFSISGWIKPKSPGDNRGIFLQHEAYEKSKRLHIVYLNNSKLRLGFYFDDLDSNSTIPANEWIYVVTRYDASNNEQSIWFNGILDSNRTADADFQGITGDFEIGSGPFNGSIDEVQVFNRSLSETEITNLYNRGLKNQHNNITDGNVLDMRFEDNFLDSSDEGNNGDPEGDLEPNSYDLTTNDNDGSYKGNAYAGSGKYNDGLILDGDGDYVRISNTNNEVFPTDNESFSISLWINKKSNFNGTAKSIMGREVYQTNGFRFTISAEDSYYSNRVSFSSEYSGGTAKLIPSDTINPNEWYNFIVTYNGTDSWFYINGDEKSHDSSSLIVSGDTDLFIGGGIGGVDNFNGSIDEVQIFDRALTEQEIQEIYNETSQRFKESGTATLKQTNITSGYNRVNVTSQVEESLNSTIDLRLGEWDVSKGYNVSDNSLVGYWTMDNTSWTDISGNGNDGTGNGDVTTGAGVYNNSGEFDGDGDYVEAGNIGEGDGYANLSILIWFKQTGGNGSEDYIISKDGSGNNDGDFSLKLQGQSFALIDQGNEIGNTEGDTTIELDQWYHGAFTYDGSEYRLYLNGEEDRDSVSDANNTIWDNPTSLQIGGILSGSSSYAFNGSIDEVMIFNRSLSEEEIKELYIKGRANWEYTDYQSVENNQANEFDISTLTTNILPEYKLNANSSDGSSLFYSPLFYGSEVSTSGFTTSFADPSENSFKITNSSGGVVAIIDDKGDMYLKQKSFEFQESLSPGENSFIIKDNSGTTISYFNSSGSLFLLGDISQSSDLSGKTSTNLEIRNATSDLVAFFDNSGNLKLKGGYVENYEFV